MATLSIRGDNDGGGLLGYLLFVFCMIWSLLLTTNCVVVSVDQGNSWQSDFWDYRTESHCQGFPMADMKKDASFSQAQTHTNLLTSHTVTPMSPICILANRHTHPALCHEQMLVQPGCAAAGLNPHVNSECLPCSQWLSSAATGLQPAGGE